MNILLDNGMLKKCHKETCTEKQSKDSKIKEQFEKVNQKIYEIKAENQKLMNVNSNLTCKISKLTTEKDCIELQIEQYKDNFKKMQDKLEKVTEVNVFKEAETQDYSKQIDQLGQENQHLKNEIAELKATIQQLSDNESARNVEYEEFIGKRFCKWFNNIYPDKKYIIFENSQ